ncbi:MAG: RecQ family ATP-dependent DNA helicase [Bacteroidetes bacterium]|nr:RecQ family ATP-dependent DNA helicase [Bacteroidota bacterium]
MPSQKNPDSLKDVALQYLRDSVGSADAQFRDGQWESIQQAVSGNRVLVVQRTGWGKTMVYTISTKLRRDQGAGPSLMISPLLALMRNQETAAFHLGLNARRMTGDNREEWNDIHEELRDDQVDILMITPERLANEMFLSKTLPTVASGLGMLIIDEAHCISDWGHDFRPDYLRIRRVQKMVPRGSAIVATTATANNRVVEDVRDQLGGNIQVSRGSLVRRSLQLHNFHMPKPSTRLAWMAWAIADHLPGSGIVYVLTRKDADLVTKWLQSKDIDAHAYYGDTQEREELEKALLNNDIKVLVATIALGMGFDKPDLSFIIHYQRPSSVIHYYQQVGRAGRGITDAYGFLMWGEEDERIADYFVDNAFPSQDEIDLVMKALEEADGGLKLAELMFLVNLKKSRIEKILKLASLESPAPVINERSQWFATGEADGFQIPPDRIERLREVRAKEKLQMREYMNHQGCLMKFLQQALDDESAKDCGRCRNCINRTHQSYLPKPAMVQEAAQFIQKKPNIIPPVVRWPIRRLSDHPIHESQLIPLDYQAAWGYALCRMFDVDMSQQILEQRRNRSHYSDEIVDAFVEVLRKHCGSFRYVTYIPSRTDQHHVPRLAEAVAQRLDIQLVHSVSRTGMGKRQGDQKNPVQRARNVANAFTIVHSCKMSTLVIDDVISSGMTFTTVAALLRYDGCPKVVPAALVYRSLSE